MSETCRTCRCYKGNKTSGLCRRNAPSPVVTTQEIMGATWPEVLASDWCWEHVPIKPEPLELTLSLRIRELNFPGRVNQALYKLGCVLVRDILRLTAADLLEVKGFSVKSLNILRKRLLQDGLCLRNETIAEQAWRTL